MTVKELIEELSNYDDDQIVAIIGDDLVTPYILKSVGILCDDNIDEENDVVILNA